MRQPVDEIVSSPPGLSAKMWRRRRRASFLPPLIWDGQTCLAFSGVRTAHSAIWNVKTIRPANETNIPPTCSMYEIFPCIFHKLRWNVCKYTIHSSLFKQKSLSHFGPWIFSSFLTHETVTPKSKKTWPSLAVWEHHCPKKNTLEVDKCFFLEGGKAWIYLPTMWKFSRVYWNTLAGKLT